MPEAIPKAMPELSILDPRQERERGFEVEASLVEVIRVDRMQVRLEGDPVDRRGERCNLMPMRWVVFPSRLRAPGVDERLRYLPGGQRRVLIPDVLLDRVCIANVSKDDPRHGKLR
jgi:hypothetical protein